MLVFLPGPVLRKNIGHMDLVFKLSWIFIWRKIWFKLSSFQETWDSSLCYHSFAIWLQVHSFTWPCLKDLSDLSLLYWIPLSAWALKVSIIFLISVTPDQEHKLLHISAFQNAAFFWEKLHIFKCLFHLRLNNRAFLGLSATWKEFTGLLSVSYVVMLAFVTVVSSSVLKGVFALSVLCLWRQCWTEV